VTARQRRSLFRNAGLRATYSERFSALVFAGAGAWVISLEILLALQTGRLTPRKVMDDLDLRFYSGGGRPNDAPISMACLSMHR
jgi:hypothetical protein